MSWYRFKICKYNGNQYIEMVFESNDEARNYAKYLLKKYMASSVEIESFIKVYSHIGTVC